MSRFKKRRVRRYRPSSIAHSGVIRRLPRPRVEINRGLVWYCLWTAARAERRVEAALRERNVATYAPVEAFVRLRRGKEVEVERPAVSRYLFVGLHGFEPQWGAVHEALEGSSGWTVGIPSLGRVLKSDGDPLIVPASALQRLADGLSFSEAEFPAFLRGSRVRPREGIWAGFVGIVEKSDDLRVRALLDLFGRKTLVDFTVDQLEAA